MIIYRGGDNVKTAVSVSKTFSIIGLIIHAFYYIFTMIGLICYFAETTGSAPSEYGVQRSGAYWIFTMLIAAAALFFYLISVTFGIVTEKKLIYFVKLILVIAAIPLYIFVGAASGVSNFIIWNVFFLIIFIVHLIPVITYFKNRTKQKVKREKRQEYVVQTSPLPFEGRSAPDAPSPSDTSGVEQV